MKESGRLGILFHAGRRSVQSFAAASVTLAVAFGGGGRAAAAASRAQSPGGQRVWLVVWPCRTRGIPFQPRVLWHRREVFALERVVLSLPRVRGPVPVGRSFVQGCLGLTWVRARTGRVLLSAYLYPAEDLVVFDRSAHRLTASALDALAAAVPAVMRRRPAGS